MMKRIITFLTIIYICFTWAACRKTETPDNPFNNSGDHQHGNVTPEPDPASIEGLHKNIFSAKCALSGCHDGTFEPDFRTVQSTYTSLVYQPVIKTTVDSVEFYSLRVEPFSITNSFLYERITTPTADYMPSNGVRLPQSHINNIASWIQAGAKDIYGAIPVKPNLQPNITWYRALNQSFQVIDTIRVGGLVLNPFIVAANSTFIIAYSATDSLDGADSTKVEDFINCRIEFSTIKDDFSSAIIAASTLIPGSPAAWASTVSSSQWTQGTIVYFRIYINDGDHMDDYEFPRNESPDYLKTYFSFYVQ